MNTQYAREILITLGVVVLIASVRIGLSSDFAGSFTLVITLFTALMWIHAIQLKHK